MVPVAATDTDRAVAVPPSWVLWLLRIAGAVLSAAMAAIHLYLWVDGYRDIPTIGLLFLLNAIGGGLLTLALLVAGRRLLGPVAVLGAVFTAGTLAALVISMTVGLFGVRETLQVPYVPSTLVVESLGTVVLAVLAGMLARSNWGWPRGH